MKIKLIVKISEADYNSLLSGNTIDGHTYSSDVLYLVEHDFSSDTYKNPNSLIINGTEYDGSSEVELTIKPGTTSIVNLTASTVTILPNVYNKWINTMSNLDITLATPTDDTIVNEYMLEFTMDGLYLISITPAVTWVGDVPGGEATYQVSIVNGIALCVEVTVDSSVVDDEEEEEEI